MDKADMAVVCARMYISTAIQKKRIENPTIDEVIIRCISLLVRHAKRLSVCLSATLVDCDHVVQQKT